jgi:two-component system sensor histidine kinase KdpD
VTDKIDRDIFNQEDREMLLNIMGNVIIALENARLAVSLKKKQNELKKKNIELKKLEKLRTELFNMLIHDLKGPLSEITANLDIIAYKSNNDNIEFIESAQSGCNTLYNKVSNLLDIASLEEGKLPVIYEIISPKELIKESIAGLLVSVRSKGLRFMEVFPEADEVNIKCDRSMLTRVMQNLIVNAISYSPPNETIKIGFRRIRHDRIEFYVEDKGPGVSKEHEEIIFDKFKQLEKKKDGREYTTGLGLSFCMLAVKAHGGRIGFESEGQEGSRFFFIIPAGNK